MMKRWLLITPLALLVVSGLWWWWPSPRSVDVTLAIAGNASTGIRDITVVVGGDKTGWAELKPGNTVHARLQPAPADVPELTLIYRLAPVTSTTPTAEQHDWRGPAVLPGQGYEIRMVLDTQGRITGTHCVKPCALH